MGYYILLHPIIIYYQLLKGTTIHSPMTFGTIHFATEVNCQHRPVGGWPKGRDTRFIFLKRCLH